MEAKQKAKELVDKYKNTILLFDENIDSKKCALIAVDEIWSLMIKFHGRHIENNLTEIKYWDNVREEIKKL